MLPGSLELRRCLLDKLRADVMVGVTKRTAPKVALPGLAQELASPVMGLTPELTKEMSQITDFAIDHGASMKSRDGFKQHGN